MCNMKDVCCNLVSVKWSIASWMSSKLEPVIWLRVLVTLAYMKGRTDVRMYVRTLYVRTDVHDVMAIKPNFLTSMGYHIFLSMVLRARAPSARAELRYDDYGNGRHCRWLLLSAKKLTATCSDGRFPACYAYLAVALSTH